MLVQFDFAVIQLRYIKAAMDNIAAYRPDGTEPATVQGLISSAGPSRTLYVNEKTALDAARAQRRVKMDTLHAVCVDFHAQARSRFRKDAVASQCIERLPVDDESFQQTLTRAEMIAALWADLPLVGAPPAAFTVGRGTEPAVTLAAFNTLLAEARALDEAIAPADQLFQKQEAGLHAKQREMEDFISAALAQGVSQFEAGSAEREIIDAIPTESPRNLPGKAAITSVTNSGPGAVALAYDAEGATSFDIWQKLAGEAEFTRIAEDILEESYEVTGLPPSAPPDQHGFYVVGRNARGFGEESDAVFVDVT